MAKTYINKATGTESISNARIISVGAPFDVRTVVDTYNDLLNKDVFSYAELYVGLMVITADTQDVYVLSVLPGKRDSATAWANNIQWKKIGGGDIDPEDYLAYYEDKLGTKVISSADELSSIENPYSGMMAFVKDDPYTSEDESGLYIYNGHSWMRVYTGSGNSGAADLSSVITTDGTVPTSGNGFTIVGNDPNALVEETYMDNGFEPNQYYTSRGLNSSDENGSGNLGDVDYITLSDGGDSYIRLNSADDDNWIEINIVDDSLGISMSDVTYLDSEGNVHTMESSPLVLPKETPVSFGANGFDFNGMTETKDDDPTEYVFGQDGSTYDDVDIYSSTALPTVYAYSDNNPVRVLTEGDKVEIVNMIENASVEKISNEEILGIF